MAGVRDIARATARFNVSDAPTHRRFTAGYYASSLHRTRAVFARACPDMAPSIDVIVRAARKIGAAELLPTHRDMKPEHVLLAHARPRSSPHSEFSVLLTADAHITRLGWPSSNRIRATVSGPGLRRQSGHADCLWLIP